MKNRLVRINDEIQKELSELLRSGIKDPRMVSMASCTRVETSADLKHCKAYISILGDQEAKTSCMEAIESAKGHIRREIASRINLRQTPEFKFILDDSLDHSFRIGEILKENEK